MVHSAFSVSSDVIGHIIVVSKQKVSVDEQIDAFVSNLKSRIYLWQSRHAGLTIEKCSCDTGATEVGCRLYGLRHQQWIDRTDRHQR